MHKSMIIKNLENLPPTDNKHKKTMSKLFEKNDYQTKIQIKTRKVRRRHKK